MQQTLYAYHWLRCPESEQLLPNGYKDITEYEKNNKKYDFIDHMVYYDHLPEFTTKINEPPNNNAPYFFIVHSADWKGMRHETPYIPEYVKQMLRKDERFHFVWWEASELQEYRFSKEQDTRIKTIRNFLKKLPAPKRRKHVVTANASIDGTYIDRGVHLEWGFNQFRFWFGPGEPHITGNIAVNRPNHKALFLGGRPRTYRMHFLYKMEDYRNYMLHSLHLENGLSAADVVDMEPRDLKNWVISNLPIKLDLTADTMDWLEYDSIVKFKNSAFLHIVPEGEFKTFYRFEQMLVSEKSFRPFALGQIGIWIGRPGILAYLHRLGYKTFPDIIDESYDNMFDDSQRLNHIIRECKRLLSYDTDTLQEIYNSVWPSIKHNHTLLQKLSTGDNLAIEAKKLFNKIGNNNVGNND
jgi:hypothetical protein